jgi:hypothetical protein
MNSVIVLDDPYNIAPEGAVEFHLTYDGPLLGASRNDTRSSHKHEVRKALHPQLFDLWSKNHSLNAWELNNEQNVRERACVVLANRFVFNGIRFVPLSWDGLGLACKLDILMLRPDQPGQTLMQSGDIDNRLKTLFDAMRIPKIGECCPVEDSPSPLFCLLEDDSLINHLSVTTDILLGAKDVNEVRLIITVTMWPIRSMMHNFGVF